MHLLIQNFLCAEKFSMVYYRFILEQKFVKNSQKMAQVHVLIQVMKRLDAFLKSFHLRACPFP